MEHVTLNNKLECPVVGIGTFMLSPVDAENSVREALKMGQTASILSMEYGRNIDFLKKNNAEFK